MVPSHFRLLLYSAIVDIKSKVNTPRSPIRVVVEVRLEFCGCVKTEDVLKASGELLGPFEDRVKQSFALSLQPSNHPPCRYNVYIGGKLVLESRKLGRRPTVDEIKTELEKRTKTK